MATEDRWIEIFQFMESEQLPYVEFSRIIEFVLCLPGSSVPCERVFSMAKKIWRNQSSNLNVETISSLLNINYNMEYSCNDFYKFVQTQPKLLRKISLQEKYEFIEKKTNAAAASSSVPNSSRNAMSFGSAPNTSQNSMSVENETVELDDD